MGMYAEWAASEGLELSEEEVAEAEEVFDLIDADGNGAHSKDELKGAFEFVKEGCPMDEEVQLSHKAFKQLVQIIQDEEMSCPTDEEKAEAQPAIDWLEAELARDGDVTPKEIHDEIKKAVDAAGIELSKEEKKHIAGAIKMLFKHVDTDKNGAIDVAEAEAAAAAFEAACGAW